MDNPSPVASNESSEDEDNDSNLIFDDNEDDEPAAKKNKNNSQPDVYARVRNAKNKAMKSFGRLVRKSEKNFVEEQALGDCSA